MPTFWEARRVVLYVISESMVSDEEFALLYDINTSKNRDIEYRICNAFNLHEISDECVVEFRFQKKWHPEISSSASISW